jgi:hypothetical protein
MTNSSTIECPWCSEEAFYLSINGNEHVLCHHCRKMKRHKAALRAYENKKKKKYNSLKKLFTKVSSLEDSHPAKKYSVSRKIPLDRVFYTDYFQELCDTFKLNIKNQKGKLILCFYDEDGNLAGIQGRSLDPNDDLRYITIKFYKEFDKIFGLERVNSESDFYVVEGPIDSLFLKNAIACADSSLINDYTSKHKENSIIVYDNEPRNVEIARKIKNAIDQGFRVVIWPDFIREKDINDMILSKINVESIMKSNTFVGASAKVKFNNWKRCKV